LILVVLVLRKFDHLRHPCVRVEVEGLQLTDLSYQHDIDVVAVEALQFLRLPLVLPLLFAWLVSDPLITALPAREYPG
jgi:hypothetical protein